MLDFEKSVGYLKSKEHYSFEDLCLLTRVLRSEIGCPWDGEQTNKSVRNAFIDETYEFIEGLDADDNKLMCEELGDVLFQIVFHCCIKSETDEFDESDVIDGICKKMILRHPHVFGDTDVKNSAEVLVNWENIKNDEKQRKTPYERLKSVAVSLPSLMRSQKLYSKACKYGLCEKKNAPESLDEAEKIIADMKKDGVNADNISHLLSVCTEISESAGVDAEEALYRANNAFTEQFRENYGK